ncbi:Asp-tRNA(Asn)/Glu-tRNA(Gln) amidotransferase subunit GatC [Candidatus Nomurabacteria bacterium]|nr:Asp-tRNA(Asn)/Glu-tRNA(Gln) amidotransferase subunit GatC [Candidatus Nomurabacteria bacterium]
MELEDIRKLANMARLDMSDEEMSEMAHDFDGILEYVGHVQEAVKLSQVDDVKFSFANVMREDVVTNEGGYYTDKIIAQFPDQEDGYLKVKQIL